jgi:hypothetical protein
VSTAGRSVAGLGRPLPELVGAAFVAPPGLPLPVPLPELVGVALVAPPGLPLPVPGLADAAFVALPALSAEGCSLPPSAEPPSAWREAVVPGSGAAVPLPDERAGAGRRLMRAVPERAGDRDRPAS